MKIQNLILASCILFTTSALAETLNNLDVIKQKYIQYNNSGVYQKTQEKVISSAVKYLKKRLQAPHQKPLALILDIDETSLSNYPDMLAMGFGGTDQQVNDAEGKGTDPVIQPTLELFRFARSNQVAVFFITGRTERYRNATRNNLITAGYKDWQGLTLKPETYHENSAAPYKIAARKEIAAKGYDIVLNIGDQESDLTGGYADKTFKMPNPYYRVP